MNPRFFSRNTLLPQVRWQLLALSVFAASLFASQLTVIEQVFAASATFVISPASADMTINDQAIFTVSIAAGANNITAAQACISYDSAKFAYMSTSYAGTQLDTTTPVDPGTDCNGSEVRLARYSLFTHPNGTFVLGTITMKALASSGSGTLSFTSDSYIYDDANTPVPPGIFTAGSNSAAVQFKPVATVQPTAPVDAAPSDPSSQSTNSKASPAKAPDSQKQPEQTTTQQSGDTTVQSTKKTASAPKTTGSAVKVKKHGMLPAIILGGIALCVALVTAVIYLRKRT